MERRHSSRTAGVFLHFHPPSQPARGNHTICRSELVLQHRELAGRLAKSLLRKWRSYCDPQDLQSIADMALCEAAHNYRPEFGARFSTFLFYHLKGRLIREIIREKTRRRFAGELSESTAQGPCEEERGGQPGAVPQPWSEPPEAAPDPEQVLLRKQLLVISKTAITGLTSLEREIIVRLYLGGETSADIARHLGYSRGHISRLHSQALKRLQKLAFSPRAAAYASMDRDTLPVAA